MQSSFQLPTLSKMNKILIITMVAMFLLSSILKLSAGIQLVSWLGLSLDGLMRGMVFQLFTFPLVEHHLLAVLFNGLIFWFIGSEIEWRFGPRQYVLFLLSSLFGGALFFLLITAIFSMPFVPLSGLAGLASGLCLAYAVFYPDRLFTFMLIFPMKAKYFCLLIIAISLYNGFFSPGRAGAWAQLGMMAGAFLWVVFKTSEGRALLGMSLAKMRKNSEVRKKPQASHLKLVKKEDEDEPPKYWH